MGFLSGFSRCGGFEGRRIYRLSMLFDPNVISQTLLFSTMPTKEVPRPKRHCRIQVPLDVRCAILWESPSLP